MASDFYIKSIIVFGKAMIRLMRMMGRNATTLPGKTALKMMKTLPEYLTAGNHITIITGTNGKTTTTKMVCSIYSQAGFTVYSNVSGANLISGVITTLIERLSLKDIKNAHVRAGTGDSGGIDSNLRIVLEVDEGAFGKFAGSLNSSIIVVTNLFRDQLDRYGELTRTRELIKQGISMSAQARVLLCADDSLSSSIYRKPKERVSYFGVAATSMRKSGSGANEAITEAGNCLFCGHAFRYTARTYGHLGEYYCPQCNFRRPALSIQCDYVHSGNNFYDMILSAKVSDKPALTEPLRITISIPGEHNVYNALAAASVGVIAGIADEHIKSGIESSRAGFGRMEKVKIAGKDVCIVLIKNPVGLDRALSFLGNASDKGGVLLLLNDNIADGTDVSWIWDVDFESRDWTGDVFVSGTRGYDMALRLKYAGVAADNINVLLEPSQAFETALLKCDSERCLYVLPNYTSLLSLRAYLEKHYGLESIWL